MSWGLIKRRTQKPETQAGWQLHASSACNVSGKHSSSKSFQVEFETMTRQHGETRCILFVPQLFCTFVGILKSSQFNGFQEHHIYKQ